MAPLPAITNEAEADAFFADPVKVDAALRRLADAIGLAGELARPQRGSCAIGMGANEVVKLLAPNNRAFAETERTCLSALEGALPIATPRLIDTGDLDGWPWLRMSRLRGRELAEAWTEIPAPARLSLATQLGECLAALHGLPAPDSVPRLDWRNWVEQRLLQLESTQRRLGCPEAIVTGLHDFVAAADLVGDQPAWLHTEVMREHLLVVEDGDTWRLSGIFDFEPAWVAPRDYEFASVGVFFSAGDRALLGEVLRAARVTASPQRLFVMAALHRYAHLGWYHKRLGGPTEHAALADAWFGT